MAKRDLWSYFRLRAAQSDAFLQALAPHFALAARCDLRLRVHPEGMILPILPRPEGPWAASEDEIEMLRGRIAEAFEAAGRGAEEVAGVPLSTGTIDAVPGLLEGVLLHLWTRLQDRPGPPESSLRRVVLDDDPAALGALIRRGRDAKLLSGESATLIELEDDAARGSLLAGLQASGRIGGLALLRPESRGGLALWLPEGKMLPEGPEVTALLNALCEAGLLSRRTEVHFVPPATADGALRLALAEVPPPVGLDDAGAPATVGAAMAPAEILAPVGATPDQPDETGPALRVTSLRIAPSAQALQALTERLTARSFPLGYRIRLAAIPERERAPEDIERLRGEIEEREIEISLLQALARPQSRLLRFTDAQLPALVDGLRKMPAALRDSRGLLYAVAHAAGRADPAHFVLYDPDQVQFEGRIPEHYWRAATEDHPITYWLDPHCEEARVGHPDEPAVFVPSGQRILPQIDSFGGALGATLKLVLGGLFADGSAVLDKPGARPAFVFTGLPPAPGTTPGTTAGTTDEIAVELIDLADFAPLQTRLRWINEHLLVRSPLAGDPEARRELAETLYSGRLAQDLRAGMAAEVTALKDDWAQAMTEILHDFDALNDAARAEVGAARQRLAAARAAVDLAQTRLAEIDAAVAPLLGAVSPLDGELSEIAAAGPALETARFAFVRTYLAEVAASEQAMQAADRKAAALHDRITALRERLRRP